MNIYTLRPETFTLNFNLLFQVRWRQMSEPNDPVWWVDMLPKDAFEEGFGLQTPMVSGHLKVCLLSKYYIPHVSQICRRH
jgi:hypothetical protein